MQNSKWIIEAANASTEYEENNTELKRRYLIKNIQEFNSIVSQISANLGTFGTGYPFYVLSKNFEGKLPVIQE